MLQELSAAFALIFLPFQTADRPVRAVTDPGVVTTRQDITPAGVQTVFFGRVYGVTFGETPSDVWVLTTRQANQDAQITRLDWAANRIIERISIKENPGLQGIQFDRAGGKPLVSATLPAQAPQDPTGRARLLSIENGNAKAIADRMGGFITAIVVTPLVASGPGTG